jgi:hypothetical protein
MKKEFDLSDKALDDLYKILEPVLARLAKEERKKKAKENAS